MHTNFLLKLTTGNEKLPVHEISQNLTTTEEQNRFADPFTLKYK